MSKKNTTESAALAEPVNVAIHNPNLRTFWLPRRAPEGKPVHFTAEELSRGPKNADGVEFFGGGASTRLPPRSSVVVPAWYAAELRNETNSAGQPTGWALRLVEDPHNPSRLTVRAPRGNAKLFQERVLRERAQRAAAEIERRKEADEARAALERDAEPLPGSAGER